MPRPQRAPSPVLAIGLGLGGVVGLAVALALAGCGSSSARPVDAAGPGDIDAPTEPVADARPPGPDLAWSRSPPGGRAPADVPQLVSITFDDNFGLADPASVGGVDDIVAFYRGKTNPAGAGNADDFDGAPIRATFYHTSIYAVDPSVRVIGDKPGEDNDGRNRAAWTAAAAAGHEVGDHTVNHFNGGVVPLDPDDCCRARDWDAAGWRAEIAACRDLLEDNTRGVGAGAGGVTGFRAPFLGYNDHLFTALSELGFAYDTSLPNCFDADEDGGNCAWPYTLAEGSPDARVLARDFTQGTVRFPDITSHPGLWELAPTTLMLPPDEVAAQYGFTPGLRARVTSRAPLPYPTTVDADAGKIAGLDYSLLIDAGLTGAEMGAVLSYNLDLHLAGNRSPLIFVAHSHLYAFSSAADNPDTPTRAERDARWQGLTAFLTYALSKPEVRVVAAADILAWVQRTAGLDRP